MNHSEISSFIWGTADLLRGSFKAHEYGDIILPFTVMRRLDIVLESTKKAVLKATARKMPDAFRDQALKDAAGQDFYNISRFTMKGLLEEASDIRENIVEYVNGFSPDIVDVFEHFKIYDVIKDLDDADLLFLVVQRFCDPKADLGPDVVDSSAMGDIYEELIRKFSEMSNETAGEHFSPRDGLALATELLIAGSGDDLTRSNPIVKVADPCAGTGGALSVFEERVRSLNPKATVVTYAQECNPQTYAICKSDTILKGERALNVHLGDTLTDDCMAGEYFGYQISNPPYGVEWKKAKAAVISEHDTLGYAGRFGAGLPRISDGQLLFVQHMVAHMRKKEDGGARIAVFLNGSPLFTGNAGSGESEIRKYLLEHDLVEAIVAMPNDFFFNTGIATYVWVLSDDKAKERRDKVQLINANGIYSKMRKSLGSKRNEFSPEQIERIVDAYRAFEESDICRIFDTKDFGYTTVTVERPLKDDDGNVVTDRKGKPKPDSQLRDTENVPLKEDVDAYFEREVKPYAPDAWMDRKKDKVGYEIPFTRFFYKYTPLRPSVDILKEIRELEISIETKLKKAQG